MVPVVLLEDQLLRYRGDQKAWLDECQCDLPELTPRPEKPAASLNHAFTLASSKYETKRRQHTANVFNRAWAHVNGGWQRLDKLRTDAIETRLSNTRKAAAAGDGG
jgi:hypothetical protein